MTIHREKKLHTQTRNAALKQSESEKQTSTVIWQVSGAKVWFLETCCIKITQLANNDYKAH